MWLIVFDLDGTLVDSRQDLADSTNDVLESFGGARLPTDRIVAMVGDGARVLVERALAASGCTASIEDAFARFQGVYDRRLLVHTRPYEGIAEVVAGLARDARLAVLTNKPRAPSVRVLDAFDLSRYFARVIGGDSEFARKPDPAALRHLVIDAGASPRTTVMVGDSMIDVETARAAGVHVCAAAYGFGAARGALTLAADEPAADSPKALGAILRARIAAA